MITSLAGLLSPHDPELLFAAATAEQRLLLRTDKATAFAKLLPWDRFNELITPDRLMDGSIEFFRDTMSLPLEVVLSRTRRSRRRISVNRQAVDGFSRQGVTIIVNDVHLSCPDIDRMNAILEREFRAPVSTNAYASFIQGGAFRPHWDDHNVLILQLQGRKHWQSWGQRWQAPIPGKPYIVPKDPGLPVWEAMLEPGDLLYLPRGEIHAAQVVAGEESLHLTVAIMPPRLDALTNAMARLCQEFAVIGRQDLPVLGDSARRKAFMDAAKTLLHQAVDRLDLETVLHDLDQKRSPMMPGTLGMARRLTETTALMPTLRRRLPLPVDGGTLVAGQQTWTLNADEAATLNLLLQHHCLTLQALAEALLVTDHNRTHQAITSLIAKGLVIALATV